MENESQIRHDLIETGDTHTHTHLLVYLNEDVHVRKTKIVLRKESEDCFSNITILDIIFYVS